MIARELRGGVLVWLLLVALTGITWWLGVRHAAASTSPRLDTIALLLIAFLKARLIILHFMELRHAPAWLRLLGEAWVVLSCGAVVLVYLSTSG